ncbi:MAG: hypothetical protein HYZ44_17555 [Bacteroidetes bacterium]|nr:hypothetical protein [Bacteroidota bacterium]
MARKTALRQPIGQYEQGIELDAGSQQVDTTSKVVVTSHISVRSLPEFGRSLRHDNVTHGNDR